MKPATIYSELAYDPWALRRTFHEDGYCIVRGLLDEETLARVLDDFDLSVRQVLEDRNLPINPAGDNLALCDNMKTLLEYDKDVYLRVLRLASRLQSVVALTNDPAILKVLKILDIDVPSLTAGVAAHIVSNELKIPGGYSGWAPHQDWTAGQGSLKQVVVWAPLMDVGEGFYPLRLIPGSHRRGVWRADRDKVISRGALIEIDPDQYGDAPWIEADMARGDVAFISGFVVHATGEGHRRGVRIACGCRFEDITEPSYIERAYPCAFNGQTATQEELHPGFPSSDVFENMLAEQKQHFQLL